MKKHFLVVALIALAAAASAQAQSYSASANPNRREAVRQQQPAQPTTPRPVGAFQRATRGNPIQMVNPRAPGKYYGPPEETVTVEPFFGRDPHTRSQITGVILFGLRW